MYRHFIPRRWQVTSAVATWPPACRLTETTRSLLPRAGNSRTRTTVSVAFSPRPTTSTDDFRKTRLRLAGNGYSSPGSFRLATENLPGRVIVGVDSLRA